MDPPFPPKPPTTMHGTAEDQLRQRIYGISRKHECFVVRSYIIAGPADDSSSDGEPVEPGVGDDAAEAEDDSMHMFSGHTGLQQIETVAPSQSSKVCCSRLAVKGCISDQAVTCADSVFAVSWSRRSGDTVASGGADDRAFLWRVRRIQLCSLA